MPKKKVLIVEDEALIAMEMQDKLEHYGYQVGRPISSGEEAILSIHRERPDVILMDIRLSGDLDGIETASKIGAKYKVPIIFITGYPDDVMMQRAQKISPIGYFVKPVNVKDICSAIDSLN